MKVKISKVMAALSSMKDDAAIGRASSISGRSILSSIEMALLRSTEYSRGRDHHTAPEAEDKYMSEILFMVSNAPGSITFLARKISTRLESTRDPVVALKTLLLLHRLLRGGDRYFEQDLRNLWSSGDLRIDLRWISSDPDADPFFSFLLNYSQFLEERMEWLINQAGKLEPAVRQPLIISGSGSGSGVLCFEEEIESVLYRLSKCQSLLDRVMDCLPAVTNYSSRSSQQAMQSAMNVVLRESFRVYESFCEGAEIAFSSFFGLKKHTRVLALDIVRKACIQTSSLHEFYESCKKCVVGKSLDYPSVRIITADQISALEQFEPKESTITRCKVEEIIKGQENGAQSCNSSTKPFPQALETKISTVWVEFDDDEEDSQSSSFSFDDLITPGGESSRKIWKPLELL